jgi:hypothetical protein
MNTATVSSSAVKPVEFYYPKSCKEFTEEQLLQHMRIPGAIWKAPGARPRRRAALPGVTRPSAGYQTVFFGAADEEEEWQEVKPRHRSRGWKGSKAAAMEH